MTEHRSEDALRAVASAVAQRPPVEVLLVDDGSTDGTAEAVAAAHPTARIERFDCSEGYIVRRNQAAGLATAPIFVSLDDDAEFRATTSSPRRWPSSTIRGSARSRCRTGTCRTRTLRRRRSPVSREAWRLYRRLGKGPRRIEEIAAGLPARRQA